MGVQQISMFNYTYFCRLDMMRYILLQQLVHVSLIKLPLQRRSSDTAINLFLLVFFDDREWLAFCADISHIIVLSIMEMSELYKWSLNSLTQAKWSS